MPVSKSRRPVAFPHLAMLATGDEKKGTKFQTPAGTAVNAFSARPVANEPHRQNPDSEQKVALIVAMRRKDITIHDVRDLIELWKNVSATAQAEIECKLFDLACESRNAGMNGPLAAEFDRIRLTAAKGLVDLPVVNRKDQLVRLYLSIKQQGGETAMRLTGMLETAIYGETKTVHESYAILPDELQ